MKTLSLDQFKKGFDVTYHKIITSCINNFFTHNLKEAGKDIKPYMHDGKRIRPYLITCMGPADERSLQAGYAIELFHAMALIHDDIIDESRLRRKSQTPHYVLMKYAHNNMHTGESLSLLWGDYIYAQSMRHISSLPQEVRELFLDMYDQTVLGQVHDVMNSVTVLENISPQDVQRVHDAKTGYYTFVYPLLIGNALQEKSKQIDKETLTRLGLSLGSLFQMRDDIIDMLPQSNKEQWKDIREGTASWVLMWLRDEHSDIYKDIGTLHVEGIFNEEKFNQITNRLQALPWQEIFSTHSKEYSDMITEIINNEKRFTPEQKEQLHTLHERLLTLS